MSKSKSYPEIRTDLNRKMSEVRKGLPELMKGSGALYRAAYAEGALSVKTKELIALAIGVRCGCDGCLAFHARGAHAQGATRQEVLEALGVAIQMGGGPAAIYAAEALAAFDQFADVAARRAEGEGA